MSQTHQTAYSISYGKDAADCAGRTYAAMFEYLTSSLGLPEEFARIRSVKEVENVPGREACDEIEAQGITFSGKTVLDLGSGLGGVALEAARRAGRVYALEPGPGWRAIAAERLAHSPNALVLAGVGENLPLATASIDLIISLQVLEHVQKPEQVIREAYRVLRPGGLFYFAYENYLGFREPHYHVPWLPLLPKSLGASYLRLRNRDPRFLLEAVTYTTFPAVRRYLRNAGLECMQVKANRDALQSPLKTSPKWKAMKSIARLHPGLALGLLNGANFARRMFRTGIYEIVRKP